MKTYQLTKFESYGLRNQSVNQCFLQFDVDDGIQNFTSFSVCLGVAEKAFSCMREYMAVAGAFAQNSFEQILLLAVGMDSEDKVTVLAWALVLTWTWFLISLKASLPAIDSPNFVLMNDREKGMLSAVSNILFFLCGYVFQAV